jgi:hypothetical protein
LQNLVLFRDIGREDVGGGPGIGHFLRDAFELFLVARDQDEVRPVRQRDAMARPRPLLAPVTRALRPSDP